MTKYSLFGWVVLISLHAGWLNAQEVIVRLHRPPPNQITVEDLWWVDLTNTTPDVRTVYLHGEVTEESEGLIFRSNSSDFRLPPGTRRVTPRDIASTWGTYYKPEYKEMILRTGKLPEGDYTICVQVIESETRGELGSDCIRHVVRLPEPPRLISPRDGATLVESHPFFAWTPPAPFPAGEFVTYKLKIVEILEGQTKEEAMGANIPWFEESDITRTSFQYPIRAEPLESGKQYAWQIQSFDESGYPFGLNEGKSEIGTFRVEELAPLEALPKVLLMGGFILENITYQSGSTLDSLSGKAESFFIQKTPYGDGQWFLVFRVSFELDFEYLKAETLQGDTGKVTAGEIIEGFSSPIKVWVEEYPVHVESLHLWPDSARARVGVGMPSLYDVDWCGPAELGPFDTRIAPEIDIYKELGIKERGPYILGETGIRIVSKDSVLIDLSRTVTPYQIGIILKKGETLEQPDMDTSNTGFLYGKYTFTGGLVTPSGFSGTLQLSTKWEFVSLAPMGFRISLPSGSLEIDSGSLKKGKFEKGMITLPQGVNGVHNPLGDSVTASFDSLLVDSLLNLFSLVKLTEEIQWGGFGVRSKGGRFRLVSEPRPFSLPVQGDSFKSYTKGARDTLTGLTLVCTREDTFVVYTEDSEKPLIFPGTLVTGWLNLEMQGLSGRFEQTYRPIALHVMLGDTGRPGYLADSSFNTIIGQYKDTVANVEFIFAGNSAFDSDMSGQFMIPYPCKINPPFRDLEVTSTASLAGGDVSFPDTMILEYWGVGITSKRGVVSVRVGEIIYMNAEISEPRHFSEGFNIYWGEMLASGDLGRFFFNYNSGNQRFDGIPFTLHTASLSPYDPTLTGDLLGYLKAKGDLHFSFWGSKKETVKDYKYADTLDPYNGRLVKITPSTFTVKRKWGSGTAKMDFTTVGYDSLDQDGFRGMGKVEVLGSLTGTIGSSIDLNSMVTNICFCSDAAEIGVGASLTPILLSGAGSNIKIGPVGGCIQIIDDKLERIYIEGPLEISGQAGWAGIGVSLMIMGNVTTEITPTQITFGAVAGLAINFSKVAGLQGMAGIKLTLATNGLKGDITGDFNSSPVQIGAQGHLSLFVGFLPPSFYLQGSAKLWIYYFGSGTKAEGAFLVALNTPRNELWALNKIGKNLTASDVLDGFGIGSGTRLTGFYGGGKFGGSVSLVGIISGGFWVWGGAGCFYVPVAGSKVLVPGFVLMGNAGVMISGDVLWGLLSASLWAEFGGGLGSPPYFSLCGAAGIDACCCWDLICFGWSGSICLGSGGISAQ